MDKIPLKAVRPFCDIVTLQMLSHWSAPLAGLVDQRPSNEPSLLTAGKLRGQVSLVLVQVQNANDLLQIVIDAFSIHNDFVPELGRR